MRGTIAKDGEVTVSKSASTLGLHHVSKQPSKLIVYPTVNTPATNEPLKISHVTKDVQDSKCTEPIYLSSTKSKEQN